MASASDRTAHRGESLGSIYLRRAVSVPVYLALALIFGAGAPLWLLCAAVYDLARRQTRLWPRTRALSFFGVYLLCEVAGILAATALGVATCGGRLGGARRYRNANAALQRWWTSTLFRGGMRLFSLKLEVTGLDSVGHHGPTLLLVRHSSSADTVLAAAVVANPRQRLLRYVLKRELLWDPCLDIVGRRLPNAFIERSVRPGPHQRAASEQARKEARSQAEIAAIVRLTELLDAQSDVLIYPEGTRFSANKQTAAVAALQQRGHHTLAAIAARYRHVLPPRLGGTLALLDAAPGIDVLFVEHTGFEGAATFSRFFSGGLIGRTLRVRLRRIAAREIPQQGRDVWLFTQWAEVDRWIDQATAHERLSQ